MTGQETDAMFNALAYTAPRYGPRHSDSVPYGLKPGFSAANEAIQALSAVATHD
jgi:hypothetical protein